MIFSAFAQGRAMRARRFLTSRPYCANLGAPREYSPKRAKAGDPMIEYYIPTQAGEAELVEKRSRFIGHVWRVESEEEARARIEEMKKRYYDARHNCWCYLLREGPVRYSDDGEPQGTAGQPMLNVFQREEVTNVCCVVTRYFGGILLGAGGLVRAYTQSAKAALDAAGISVVRRWVEGLLPCSYSQYERVKLETESLGGVVAETDYGADIVLTALLPEERAEAFSARLTELAAGGVAAQVCGESFQAVPRTQV